MFVRPAYLCGCGTNIWVSLDNIYNRSNFCIVIKCIVIKCNDIQLIKVYMCSRVGMAGQILQNTFLLPIFNQTAWAFAVQSAPFIWCCESSTDLAFHSILWRRYRPAVPSAFQMIVLLHLDLIWTGSFRTLTTQIRGDQEPRTEEHTSLYNHLLVVTR